MSPLDAADKAEKVLMVVAFLVILPTSGFMAWYSDIPFPVQLAGLLYAMALVWVLAYWRYRRYR